MKFTLENDEKITLADLKKDDIPVNHVYYFSNSNKKESLDKLAEGLEKVGKSVFLKKIKYSTNDNHFVYSMRIL